MKNKFVLTILASLFISSLTTACEAKHEEQAPNRGQIGSVIQESQVTQERFVFNREQIDTVIIEDSVKGYYEDDLRIELNSSELSAFISLVPELELRDGQTGQGSNSGSSYNIVCMNEKGELLYTFTVDSAHNLNMEDMNLKKNDVLDGFLDKLEDKYGIKTVEDLKRNPGAGYFALTDRIAKMDFYEFTETNFDIGINYTLKEEEVEELKKGIANASLDRVKETAEEDYLYRITACDKWGSSIYFVTVTSGNEVDINGRAVEYDSIKEWLEQMERVSGYVRAQN